MGSRESGEARRQEELSFRWEWARTVPRAIHDDVNLSVGERRVQLVLINHHPSGGVAWEIRSADASWRIFRSEVRDEDDVIRLVGYEELDAPSEELRGFFDRLRSIDLRVGPLDDDFPRDATIVELAWSSVEAGVRFRWAMGAAHHWRRLERVADEMIEAFRPLRPKGS